MNVGGTPLVAARNDGVKDGQTVGVGGLHAAESPELEDGRVLGVAHAGVALDAGVDALEESATADQGGRPSHRRVGAPDIDIGVGHDLAGLVVDDLDGQGHLDAGLALGDVLADFLATDVLEESARSRLRIATPPTQRALVDVGHENAGTGVLEQGRGVHVLGHGLVGLVVDPRDREVVTGAERASTRPGQHPENNGDQADAPFDRLLETQAPTKPRILVAVKLDGPLDEIGVVERPRAVVEVPGLEGVRGRLLVVAGVGKRQGRGQQGAGKKALETHDD